MKKVVAYALYGNRLFYWQYLKSLVRAHHTLFPGWELRLYMDSTISAARSHYVTRLAQEGLINLKYAEENKGKCRSMLWRMKPVWEDDVEYVLCRDIDSLPTIVEARMVKQFVDSKTALHVFNENESHTATVMGGMCGFHAPQYKHITGFKDWNEFISSRPGLDLAAEMGGPDQTLLHYSAWEKCFPNVCEHRLKGISPQPGSMASYTTVEPIDVELNVKDEEAKQRVINESHGLTPCLGAPGYGSPEATAFYNQVGEPQLIEKLLNIEKESTVEATIVRTSHEPNQYALMSSDEETMYAAFLPLTAQLWKEVAGYHPYAILVSDSQFQASAKLRLILKTLHETDAKIKWLPSMTDSGLSTNNVAQCSRLYGGLLDRYDTDFIMTIDVDMWPCQRGFYDTKGAKNMHLWNFQGIDSFFICFCRASVADWREIMQLQQHDNMAEKLKYQLLAGIGQGKQNWGYDEALLNARLREWPRFNTVQVYSREVQSDTSLPVGRIDRANWPITMDRWLHSSGKTDAHVVRPLHEYWPQHLRPLYEVLSPQTLPWADKYVQAYLETP